MTIYFYIIIAAFTAASVFTPVAGWIAKRSGAIDRCDGFRKTSGRNVPLAGGWAVFLVFAVVSGAVFFIGDYNHDPFVPVAMFAGLLSVLLMGSLDDIFGLGARWRLAAQFAVAVLMYRFGFAVDSLSVPYFGSFHFGWFAGPFTVFWFLGCMNSMNLIDGSDGLAVGIALFAVGALLAVSLLLGNMFASVMLAALWGCMLGFLRYNFPPASVFLGNSGSYAAGFMIAALSLPAVSREGAGMLMLIPITAMGLPATDTALAILRRFAGARPLSVGDRQHLHHQLIDKGWSMRKSVLVLYALSFVLACVSVALSFDNDLLSAALLVLISFLALNFTQRLWRPAFREMSRRFVNGRKRRAEVLKCRSSVHIAAERLKRAETLEEIWDLFGTLAADMQLDSAVLKLPHAIGCGEEGVRGCELRWQGRSLPLLSYARWSAVYPLYYNGSVPGELELSKTSFDPATEPQLSHIAHELSLEIAENIRRIDRRTEEKEISGLFGGQ